MTQPIVHIAAVRDDEEMRAKGITFTRQPKEADDGPAAVFGELYGSLQDLMQVHAVHPMHRRGTEP